MPTRYSCVEWNQSWGNGLIITQCLSWKLQKGGKCLFVPRACCPVGKFPLPLSWKFNWAACPFKNSLSNSNIEEHCWTRANQEQNWHWIEQVCSPQYWLSLFIHRNSEFLLCLPILNWKNWMGVFISQTTRANPVFKSSVQNTNWTVCHRIKWACSSIKVAHSLSLTLCPSYAEQQ